VAMFIVDRRLNSGSKSLENRQRFLCRAKALVQGAVKKTFEGRDIKDVLEGGEVSIPLVGINQPHDLELPDLARRKLAEVESRPQLALRY
jgi:uncharacterized protein